MTPSLPEVGEDAAKRLAHLFRDSPDSVSRKLRAFPKYVPREAVGRFLALYELFRRIRRVKGSIVECGVYRGFSLLTWAKVASVLEPENVTRRIYGFDSFAGFPAVTDKDRAATAAPAVGDMAAAAQAELAALIAAYDADRPLGQIAKVELVPGEMTRTIPEFLARHPHLVVSLLFIDCDLYEPTRAALTHFVPRMPRGAVLAFDELDRPAWPGETLAVLETIGLRGLRLRRLDWEPHLSYAVLE
jgi:Macrocin-O-methyltransferase (TylF)